MALGALVAACFAFPATASAVTFDVVSTTDADDAIPGDGVCAAPAAVAPGPCTLRAAITESNEISAGDRAIINVQAGTYTLTRPNTSGTEDENLTGDLDIDRGVIIKGAGARTTVINGNRLDGV